MSYTSSVLVLRNEVWMQISQIIDILSPQIYGWTTENNCLVRLHSKLSAAPQEILKNHFLPMHERLIAWSVATKKQASNVQQHAKIFRGTSWMGYLKLTLKMNKNTRVLWLFSKGKILLKRKVITKTRMTVLPTTWEQENDSMIPTVVKFYNNSLIYVNKLRNNLMFVMYETLPTPERYTYTQKHSHSNISAL